MGDVAQSGGAKQARACMMQGEVAVENILSLIKSKNAAKEYKPQFFEGMLNLTLGTVSTLNPSVARTDIDVHLAYRCGAYPERRF